MDDYDEGTPDSEASKQVAMQIHEDAQAKKLADEMSRLSEEEGRTAVVEEDDDMGATRTIADLSQVRRGGQAAAPEVQEEENTIPTGEEREIERQKLAIRAAKEREEMEEEALRRAEEEREAARREEEERRAVGNSGRLLHVVRHDHDRVLLLKLDRELLDPPGRDRVKRRGRLVHEEDLGLHGERAGDA